MGEPCITNGARDFTRVERLLPWPRALQFRDAVPERLKLFNELRLGF